MISLGYKCDISGTENYPVTINILERLDTKYLVVQLLAASVL